MTEKQARVLHYYRQYIAQHGYSPTSGECCADLGLTIGQYQGAVRSLLRKGIFVKTPRVNRGVTVAEWVKV
jgi:SOS-response transcriptional repressor LexA